MNMLFTPKAGNDFLLTSNLINVKYATVWVCQNVSPLYLLSFLTFITHYNTIRDPSAPPTPNSSQSCAIESIAVHFINVTVTSTEVDK